MVVTTNAAAHLVVTAGQPILAPVHQERSKIKSIRA